MTLKKMGAFMPDSAASEHVSELRRRPQRATGETRLARRRGRAVCKASASKLSSHWLNLDSFHSHIGVSETRIHMEMQTCAWFWLAILLEYPTVLSTNVLQF